MTRSEVADKISRFLGAYETRARTRGGPSAEDGADFTRAAGVLVAQYIEDVDASLRTDMKEGA